MLVKPLIWRVQSTLEFRYQCWTLGFGQYSCIPVLLSMTWSLHHVAGAIACSSPNCYTVAFPRWQRFIKANNARCFFSSILEASIYFTGLRGSVQWVFRGRFLLSVKEEMPLSFPVLVSNGCNNKWPQTWGLKTREIYSLIALGIGVQNHITGSKARCWHSHLPPELLGDHLFLASFSFGGCFIPWFVATLLQFLPLCSFSLFSLGNF